jgi:hypothetical protein
MFEKIIKRILIASVVAFYFYGFFIYDMHKNEKWLNDEICDFAKQEVKSKVQERGGHGRYNWLKVHDSMYYYQVSKLVVDSFGKNTLIIEVGDSIVKKANSKRVIVYRGDKRSIFILRCED